MFASELLARGILESCRDSSSKKKNNNQQKSQTKPQKTGCRMPCYASSIKCTPLPFTKEASAVFFSGEQMNG